MTLRIYTRTGDDGSTGLFGGARVAKDDDRIEACGAVDALNASLGAALALLPTPAAGGAAPMAAALAHTQHLLFTLGTTLGTPAAVAAKMPGLPALEANPAAFMEAHIDALEAQLPPLKHFILPGGSPLAAALHLARASCRCAERRVVRLARQQGAVPPACLLLLNRLSDLLFVMARAANQLAKRGDVVWDKAAVAPS